MSSGVGPEHPAERLDRGRSRFAIGALAVLLVLVGVALWPRAMRRDGGAPRAAESPVETHEPPSVHVERTLVRSPATESAVTALMVGDERGVPLPDVGAWVDDPRADWLVRSDPSFLGATGEDGVLRFSSAAEESAIQVGRPGFLTQRIVVATGVTTEVRLIRGGSVRFLCRMAEDGPPAADIDVVVSGTPTNIWPLRDQWPEAPPGAIPVSPVERTTFRGRSGGDGVVTLDGLPQGALAWFAWSDALVLSGGPGLLPPDETEVIANGTTYELEFRTLMAAGFRLDGDSIVTSRGTPNPRGLPRITTPGHHTRHGIEQQLRARFPGGMVYVSPAPPGATIEVSLVLRDQGRHSFRLPFLPLDEFIRTGPVVVDARSLPQEGTQSSAVTLHIRNPDGTDLGPIAGYLWADDERMIMPVSACQPKLVPHGRYRFIPDQPFVRSCLPDGGRLTVGVGTGGPLADGNIDLVLTHVLRPVRVLRPEGLAHVTLVDEAKGVVTPIELDGSEEGTILHVPDGYSFVFRQGGSDADLGRVDLSRPSQEATVVRLEVPK